MSSTETRVSRRYFLSTGAAAVSLSFLDIRSLVGAESDMPQSVSELWEDFDPRRDPLEVETVREWKEDGGVFRHVRYLIGFFKGRPARMAAIYGFPEGAKERLSAVMHIHGGGQRGSLDEVKLLVERGYAALSVNWGGSGTGKPPFNSCEKSEPGDPNTDWGAVDPSQLNVQGYGSMLPGPKQFYEDREHPKNNNWYLLTLGCRRGLTFLEQQGEVDPLRLGVHGFSMGGNLTMYVAGTDYRVKAAVPAVGGQGWRWQAHDFNGIESRPQDDIKGNIDVFRRTLSYESYAPRIKCPVLHRSATNDFHGWMDDVYRTNALIPNQPTRYCWTPHVNHRLSPEVAVAMPLWFDHFLKDGPALPQTPQSTLALTPEPLLRVVPAKHAWPASRCEVFYSVDPDPRARFWRSAEVIREEGGFEAKLPLHTRDLPLFAFANVYHTFPKPESMKPHSSGSESIREVCLSSLLHSVTVDELRKANPSATAPRGTLIDDFGHGLRDWYQLNADHITLTQTWTRKLTDPLYRGAPEAKLKFTLKMPRKNRLKFVIIENEWRSYRGKAKTYVCTREIPGGDGEQTLGLSLDDFIRTDHQEESLKSWSEIDQFGICVHFTESHGDIQNARWDGPRPEFVRLEWA